MNEYNVVLSDYRDYLITLKKSIFKILPLYEESNEYLLSYLNDTIEDVIYVKEIINKLPHGYWYVQTLDNLLILKNDIQELNNHRKIKKRVLGTGSLIQQEINKLNEKE